MDHMILAPDKPVLCYLNATHVDDAHAILHIGLMLLITGLYMIILEMVDAIDSTYSLFMLVDDSDDGIDFMPAMMRHHSIR